MLKLNGFTRSCRASLWVTAILSLAALTAHADTTTFAIEPQDLSGALKAFAVQSHREIFFAPELARGRKSNGVKGKLDDLKALNIILEGTGLNFSVTASNAILVRDPTSKSESSRDGAAPTTSTMRGADNPSLKVAQADSTQNPTSDNTNVPDSKSKEEENAKLDEIVVTGTHIRGVSPTSSVLVLDQEYIQQSGYTNVGDVLRTLPQNYAGGSSPQVNTGSTPGANGNESGGSAPNLHGLGSTATLTLIDGHRLADDSSLGAVDISLIPVDAIDRIEVLTDGASSIYGSDAVAGVVNIILKKNYQGVMADASIGGATDGGALDRRISVLAGTNWENGGGVLNYEHDQLDAVNTDQRDFTSTALTPATLLPPSSRNSVYGYIHEDFADRFSSYVQGLYTSRSTTSTQTFPYIPPVNFSVSSPTPFYYTHLERFSLRF